jgi:flagellar protein FliO/FliZ
MRSGGQRKKMDLVDFARYFAALLLVLGLIGFAAIGARRFGVPGLAKPMDARRIKIVESLMLSPRQRLAIIRRDNVEHLVMIGPDGASVIETGIVPPPDAAT